MKIRINRVFTTMFLFAFLWGPLGAFAAGDEPLPPGDTTEKVVPASEAAEEERPTLSADVAFLSKYIWRGYELSRNSLVIQPSVTAGYKGFGLNIWGNLDTDMYGYDQQKWNETDMTVSYDHSFGPVGLGVGYIYYALDGTDDTQEFYVSLGGDVLLAPTLTVYRDVDEYHGWYIDLGLSHSFDLPHEITLDLGASFAYYISDNDSIVDYDHNGDPTTSRFKNFQNGLLSVGMTIPFAKDFSVAPMIAYSFPLGGAADKMLKGTSLSNDASHFFGGVTLSMAF